MGYEQGHIRTDRGLFYDKGNLWWDPRHPDFAGGAKFDGVSDDAPAIRACIEEATAGSRIAFPAFATAIVRSGFSITKRLHFYAAEGFTIDVRLPIDDEETMFDVQASHVSFVGLTFDGTNAPAGVCTTRHIMIFAGTGVTPVEDITVQRCRFVNLTRKGATDSGDDASLKSDYAVYFNNVTRGRILDCEADQLSGVFAFVSTCEGVWIERNTVRMLDGHDHIYAVHIDESNDRVWVCRNEFLGTGHAQYGGIIDVMSNGGENRRVYINENVIDGGTSDKGLIRILGTSEFECCGNTIRNSDRDGQTYIQTDYRDLPVETDGPVNGHIMRNRLVAAADDQRGIDARNDRDTGEGGNDVIIEANILNTDGTHFFAAGIRARDIQGVKVRGNIVHYKFSADTVSSWGIEVSESTAIDVVRPVISGNEVNCYTSASSRGIIISGDVVKPIIHDNLVVDWGAFGLRLENTVEDPSITDNRFDGPDTPTAISNQATGDTFRRNNRLSLTEPSSGTWTITSGANNTTVTTAEVRTGDHITLNVRGNVTTDEGVKVSTITDATSFVIRTFDHGATGADVTGTWQIVH